MRLLGRTLLRATAAWLLSAAILPLSTRADNAPALSRHTRPGGQVSITLATGGADTCTVDAGGRRRTADVDGATRIRIGFRVAQAARPGTWRVSVVCSPGIARRVVVTVRGRPRKSQRSSRLVSGQIRIAVLDRAKHPATPAPATPPPTAAGPMSEADALARARADWVSYGPSYLSVFRNGQCTDWAAQNRPDIVEAATVRLWADHFMGRPDLGISWDGGYWDDMARAARLSVGTVPRAGAVVTFDPGTMGASGLTGHVAYVESVNADGTFTVSEMNAPYPWQLTYRTIPVDAIAGGGIAFVY